MAKRSLRAKAAADLRQELALHASREQAMRGEIEALIGRHWPELIARRGLTAATLLELLARYGRPSQVAADAARDDELARQTRDYGGNDASANERPGSLCDDSDGL